MESLLEELFNAQTFQLRVNVWIVLNWGWGSVKCVAPSPPTISRVVNQDFLRFR